MRYKHIATVGTVLIAIFILLAALMYYFNQDSCPLGTFPCANSTKCLPQRDWCNGRIDCNEGDDESDKCFDYFEDFSWYNKKRNKSSSSTCPDIKKGDQEYYSHCEYGRCAVRCIDFPDYDVPQNFPSSFTLITFYNSTLPTLKANYFSQYHKLIILNLKNNSIHLLERNVFLNQQKLLWLALTDNRIQEISEGHLVGLKSLESFLANNNELHICNLKDLENSTTLELLVLQKNLLRSSNLYLPYLPKLKELDLDENSLDTITDDTFSRLPMLSSLTMEYNEIQTISANAFKNSTNLRDLNLMFNKITTVSPRLFVTTKNLRKLSLGYNPVKDLSLALVPLTSNLNSLNVEDIDMDDLEKNWFNMFTELEFLYFRKFHYCTTYAPNVKKCKPSSDGVSSLSHLLGKPLLRAAVWGIACVTCLGNALVLWGRFTAKDENRVLSIIIRNLAVSDMLMGLYLLIIGIKDIRFRDNYILEANEWISSWSCTFIGMLAMTSSEVSVLILSFMSIERFMLIAAPLKGHRAITPQTAAFSMIVVWLFGVTLALIPAVHWRSSTRFYGLNGMCFPLHIDDPLLIGWEYSAFIFLGLNLLGLVTIGYVYVGMFVSIWKTRHATPLSVGDSEFALRFFLIVLTDAVCWSPIIVLKIMALAKYPVDPDLNAWVVIFILPVNSAVNPLLYTFTTPKFRERLNEGWFGKVRNAVSRKQSRSDSQTSTTVNLNTKNTMPSTSTSMKFPTEEKKKKKSFKENFSVDTDISHFKQTSNADALGFTQPPYPQVPLFSVE